MSSVGSDTLIVTFGGFLIWFEYRCCHGYLSENPAATTRILNMQTISRTGLQFEDEVRNIARSLYSNGSGQGSENVDGRERDGVFWNGSFFTVVEATTDKAKQKAEKDGKKTHDLVIKLRQKGFMAQGFLVTRHEPTPDQKDIIKTKKFDRTTKIISFDELRSQLFDSLAYINNREKKRFGSVYDHVENNYEVSLEDFVEPTITDLDPAIPFSLSQMIEGVCTCKRMVLVAEYGVGKSMLLREVFHALVKKVHRKDHYRTPIAINLRDHLGQTDPIELLERHARANAANPQNLVAAWNAGYVDLLIDGFDELSTRGWTGDVKRLREYRRSSHSVVRKLIKETPAGCGIIIAGRDAYFDSFSEMREALGASENQFQILRVHPFDECQAMKFLSKKSFKGSLPEWIPTRPLLLTYLVTKGLLQSAIEANSGGDYPRGSAWLSLLDMIAARESEQSEGVDKESLVSFFGALGVRSRHSAIGQASFSPQQMEQIFFSITGTTIMEDERNLLLRLPGLGAAQDNALNRSFIDDDLLNACCALPILRYTQDPYTDYSETFGFEALSQPLSDVGIEALVALIERAQVPCGQVSAAIDNAVSFPAMQLAFDLLRVSLKQCENQNFVTLEGIEIVDLDLSNSDFDGSKIDFSGCLINRVVLPSPEETNMDIIFTECLIGSVEGRVSAADLNNDQFIGCEVSEFTHEYSVNSEVLETTLPLGLKVLVVTLRKIFKQYGSSRLESALYRGLDQRSKMLVPEIVSLLLRNGFIVPTGRQGKITYSGTKSKRDEALKIIQSPNASDSAIVQESSKLG